jgi:hypothetical protein
MFKQHPFMTTVEGWEMIPEEVIPGQHHTMRGCSFIAKRTYVGWRIWGEEKERDKVCV